MAYKGIISKKQSKSEDSKNQNFLYHTLHYLILEKFIAVQAGNNSEKSLKAMQKLTKIWEDGARVTHKDLNQKEIAKMRDEIQSHIKNSQNLLIAYQSYASNPLGFIATQDDEITMLFIAPQHFRKKLGKSLIKEAYTRYLHHFTHIRVGSIEYALPFYESLGFEKDKSPKHEQDDMLIPLIIEAKELEETLKIAQHKDFQTSRCDWIYQGYKTSDKAMQKLYQDYHDFEWGVPQHDEKRLFEQLVLEGMQAGLSWITILKKREAFREVFDDFDPAIVAKYDEVKIESLMANAKIIRNRAKIESAINNAKRFLEIQKEFGSFDKFIWSYVGGKPIINAFKNLGEIPTRTPLSDRIAKDLKKRGFSFVGSVGIYAFMQSIGLVCDHLINCAFYREK